MKKLTIILTIALLSQISCAPTSQNINKTVANKKKTVSINEQLMAEFFNLSSAQQASLTEFDKPEIKKYLALKPKDKKAFWQFKTKLTQLGYLDPSNRQWYQVFALVNNEMENHLNEPMPAKDPVPQAPTISKVPANIPEPKLPAVIPLEKDPFENKRMFNQRLAKMRQQRAEQIADIMQPYREKVNERNLAVAKIQQEYDKKYAQYLVAIQKYEAHEKQKQIDHKNKLKVRRLAHNKKKKEQELLAVNFKKVFGKPKITALQTAKGTPKYNPETGDLHALVYWGSAKQALNSKEVVFNSPAELKQAKGLYQDLRQGKIKPKINVSFKNKKFAINGATINHNKKSYVANLSKKNFVASKEVKIVLGYKDRKPINQVTNLDIKAQPVRKIHLQNLAIKDVQFEIALDKELQDFNDNEIRSMLAKKKVAPKNESKWLFVVGIEKYQETDKINFSKRSAELFAQTAMKTLGVPKHNVYFITDDGTSNVKALEGRTYKATAGSFRNQLRYLVRDIKAGDQIYFYYSGHGVPVTLDENAPYLMARDMVADFLHDEKFFKAENIYRFLSNSRASKVIAFMDSCFTGVADGKSVFAGSKAATRLAPKKVSLNTHNIAIISAGNHKQFSSAFNDKGHRLFSYYLVKALLNNHKKLDSLFVEIRDNTYSQSRKLGGANVQKPVLQGSSNLTL